MDIQGTIQRAARLSRDLGIRTVDLQGDIAELAGRVTEQAGTIEKIGAEAVRVALDGESVADVAGEAQRSAADARDVIDDSSRQLSAATTDVVELIDQVTRIHESLGSFNDALSTVSQVTAVISGIAGQTNLLALNATIEAARAGEAGRGFAVVASEVKKLAQETAAATQTIEQSIATLTGQAGGILTSIARGVDTARSAHQGTRDIEALVEKLSSLMRGLSDNSDSVAERIHSMVASVGAIRSGLGALSDTSTDNASGLQRLSGSVSNVSNDTHVLLQYMAESGVEIPDSPYIRMGTEAAAAVAAALEADIAEGRISDEALFDEHYVPVPGTNPLLHTHPIQPLITAAMRPWQEKARKLQGFFTMAASDRNGYGAVAMPERSQSQRPNDPVWNLSNARAGMIFDDPDILTQCRITQPFCLRGWRRLGADGKAFLVSQVVASIHVRGRHWGVIQLAYMDQKSGQA